MAQKRTSRNGGGGTSRPPSRQRKSTRKRGGRSIWSKLFYAGIVLCLWGVIAVGSVVAYYASQLPRSTN